MIWSTIWLLLMTVMFSASAEPHSPNPNAPTITLPRVHKRHRDGSSEAYHQTTREEVIKSLARPKRHARRAINSSIPPPPTITYEDTAYTLFYSGSGFIETDDNPSNTYAGGSGFSAKTQKYPGTTTQTNALDSCAAFAREPDYYYAFQLYYRSDTDDWTCTAYYHLGEGGPADSNPSYFNVATPAAGPVFGYQVEA